MEGSPAAWFIVMVDMKDRSQGFERRATDHSGSLRVHRNNEAEKREQKTGWFRRFAHCTAAFAGCPACFAGAVILIIAWALTGPLFHFSDTWQLVINTATTVITFLMVFLIQNTQNRDAKAIHLKLDELIHSIKGAR